MHAPGASPRQRRSAPLCGGYEIHWHAKAQLPDSIPLQSNRWAHIHAWGAAWCRLSHRGHAHGQRTSGGVVTLCCAAARRYVGSEHGLIHDGLQTDGQIELRLDWRNSHGTQPDARAPEQCPKRLVPRRPPKRSTPHPNRKTLPRVVRAAVLTAPRPSPKSVCSAAPLPLHPTLARAQATPKLLSSDSRRGRHTAAARVRASACASPVRPKAPRAQSSARCGTIPWWSNEMGPTQSSQSTRRLSPSCWDRGACRRDRLPTTEWRGVLFWAASHSFSPRGSAWALPP